MEKIWYDTRKKRPGKQVVLYKGIKITLQCIRYINSKIEWLIARVKD